MIKLRQLFSQEKVNNTQNHQQYQLLTMAHGIDAGEIGEFSQNSLSDHDYDDGDGVDRGEPTHGPIYFRSTSSRFDNDDEDLILQSIKHSPYDDDLWSNKAEADALGKYDDFHTIDWSRDRMRDRIRFRKVKKMKYQGTLWEKIKVCCFILIPNFVNNSIYNQCVIVESVSLLLFMRSYRRIFYKSSSVTFFIS